MNARKKYWPGFWAIVVLALAVVLLNRWYNAIPGNHAVPEVTRPSEVEFRPDTGITMTVDRVEGTNFFLTFRNDTDVPYEFGWGCSLEKRVDGVWYELERKEDVAFTAEAYAIQPDSKLAWEESVNYFGRSLDQGQYRLLKGMIGPGEPGDHSRFFTIAAEFSID